MVAQTPSGCFDSVLSRYAPSDFAQQSQIHRNISTRPPAPSREAPRQPHPQHRQIFNLGTCCFLYYHFSVLDNLDSIDWSKINHCYGPATGLPATLRALATGDKKQRERALWELHGNIWHQGTLYEATAYAVPFLLELVKSNPYEYADVLGLLALIANGTSYLQVHGKLLKMSEGEYRAQLARELEWVVQARKAVAQGSDLFLELLGAKDPKLRDMSIFLLGLTVSILQGDIGDVEIIERILGIES